jgi:AcrR family transcriptional regulator
MQEIQHHPDLPAELVPTGAESLPPQQIRLLSAALQTFSRKEYHRASVSDIVTCARTSKTTFYKYYQNKSDLLAHLFHLTTRLLINRVEEVLAAHPPTAERTRLAIRTYIDTCFKYRIAAKLLMIDTVGQAAELEEKRREVIGHFAGIFQRELMSHSRLSRQEQWILSHAMVGAVHQVVVQSLQLPELPSSSHLARVLENMLSKILREDQELPQSKAGDNDPCDSKNPS